jgi:hypothetical protein
VPVDNGLKRCCRYQGHYLREYILARIHNQLISSKI